MVRLATNGMTEKDLEGGGNKPVPGMYHAYIEEVFENEEGGFASLKFQVLAGTVGDEVGKTITERFYFSGGDESKTATCIRRLARLAIALGLASRNQIGGDLDVDFGLAEGRHCVIKVVERDYVNKDGEKKKTTNVDFFGFWSTNDSDVQQVPKNAEFLSLPTGEALGVAKEPAGAGANSQPASNSNGNASGGKASDQFSDL